MSPGPRFHQDAIAWPECCSGAGQARTDTARGTDGTKDIGRLRALVPERRGSAAASRPAPGEHGFLADPGLILPPNFYRGVGREPGSDLPQPGGEVFLKSSTANSFCPLWRGRADILRNPSALNSRPTVVSTEMRNSSNIQCARSFRRQRTTPWIAGIGPLSTSRASRLSVPVAWPAGLSPCRQSDHPAALKRAPVADHLEPDSTDPRRIRATVTIVNLSGRILRRLG